MSANDYTLFATKNKAKRDDNELHYGMAVINCCMCGYIIGNMLQPIDANEKVNILKIKPVITTMLCCQCAETVMLSAQLLEITTMPAVGNSGRYQYTKYPKGGEAAAIATTCEEDFKDALDNGTDIRLNTRLHNFVAINQEK